MNTIAKSFFLVLMLLAMGTAVLAQDLSLKGRSALELNFGFWGGTKSSNTIGPTGVQSEAKTGAFLGGLEYSYWLQEHLSLTVEVSVLSAQATATVSASNITQQASAVLPFLVGLRLYIPETQGNIRPFLSAALGIYFGSEAQNTLLVQQAHTESTFGGRLGMGVEFFAGNHFKVGVNAGYHGMLDFAAPIGARKNYNGAEFSFGLGYVF